MPQKQRPPSLSTHTHADNWSAISSSGGSINQSIHQSIHPPINPSTNPPINNSHARFTIRVSSHSVRRSAGVALVVGRSRVSVSLIACMPFADAVQSHRTVCAACVLRRVRDRWLDGGCSSNRTKNAPYRALGSETLPSSQRVAGTWETTSCAAFDVSHDAAIPWIPPPIRQLIACTEIASLFDGVHIGVEAGLGSAVEHNDDSSSSMLLWGAAGAVAPTLPQPASALRLPTWASICRKVG